MVLCACKCLPGAVIARVFRDLYLADGAVIARVFRDSYLAETFGVMKGHFCQRNLHIGIFST